MKKIAALLTVIMAISLIFCSCAAGSKTEETTAEATSAAPVFEESTYETESVFAQDEAGSDTEESTLTEEENSTFSVG